MERPGKDFRFLGHRANLKSRNITIYLIEYLNTVQDKTYIFILHRNEYTMQYDNELIQLKNIEEIIPIVDEYVERGYTLNNPDYKKYLSHDYDDL